MRGTTQPSRRDAQLHGGHAPTRLPALVPARCQSRESFTDGGTPSISSAGVSQQAQRRNEYQPAITLDSMGSIGSQPSGRGRRPRSAS